MSHGVVEHPAKSDDLGLPDSLLKSVVAPVEATLDTAVMSCKCVITTQGEDRSGDIVETAGLYVVNHAKNPLVLLNHYRLIGKAETPEGVYTVEVKDGLAIARSFFSNSIPESVQAYRLVEERILRGVSIGFISKREDREIIEGPPRDGSSYPSFKGWRFKKSELLEYSHCPLQDNPDALVLLEKGFVGSEAMLPSIRKSLADSVKGLQNRPDSVSVPAEIENLKAQNKAEQVRTTCLQEEIAGLKAELEKVKQLAPQEKTMPTNPETPGAGGTNPNPAPVNPTPVPVEKDADADLPYGARYLKACHGRLLDLHDHHKAVGGSRRQEDALVKEYVRGAVAECEKTLDRVCDLFGELYPDLPQLDRPDDAEGQSEKAAAVKERIAKTLADFRMDRARKGQELTGTPARKACEDLAGWVLNKALAAKTAEELAAVKAEGAAVAARLKQLAEGVVPDAEDQRVAQVQPLVDSLLAELAETRKELKRAKAGR